MRVPSALIGKAAEVTPRAAKLAREILGTGNGNIALVDLADTVVAIQGPNPLVARELQYQGWMLVRAAGKIGGLPAEMELARRTLSVEWGGLSFLGQDSQVFVARDPWFAPALLAWLESHWDAIVPIESNFGTPSSPRKVLWDAMSNLHKSAVHLGIPVDEIWHPTRSDFQRFLQQLRSAGKLTPVPRAPP